MIEMNHKGKIITNYFLEGFNIIPTEEKTKSWKNY
jgi:hypothetical protein